MRKAVLIGAGLGLAMLVAGAVWVWSTGDGRRAPMGSVVEPTSAPVSQSPVAVTGTVNPGSGLASPASSATDAESSASARKERRRKLSEVRAEFNALRAQGADASPERLYALVDELEALSQPGMDPRYFSTLRKLLQLNARVQALNKELSALSKSASPATEMRRKEIVDQMAALGQEVNTYAQQLQQYAAQLVNNSPKP